MEKIDNKLIDIGIGEIKYALAQYASEHSCMRTKPVNEINIGNIDVRNAYEYVLVSFTETRLTKIMHVPYLGKNYFIAIPRIKGTGLI